MSSQPKASEDASAWWGQSVYFNGEPTPRREILVMLSAEPQMSARATRLLLETAVVAPVEFADIDGDGNWITVAHHHVHIDSKGKPDAGVGPVVKKMIGGAISAGKSIGHHVTRALSHLWNKVKGGGKSDSPAGKDAPKASKGARKLKKDAGVKKLVQKLKEHNSKQSASGKKPSLGSMKTIKGAKEHKIVGHLVNAVMHNHSLHEAIKSLPSSHPLRQAIKKYKIHVDGDGKGSLKAGPGANPGELAKQLEKAAHENPALAKALNKSLKKSKDFRGSMRENLYTKPKIAKLRQSGGPPSLSTPASSPPSGGETNSAGYHRVGSGATIDTRDKEGMKKQRESLLAAHNNNHDIHTKHNMNLEAHRSQNPGMLGRLKNKMIDKVLSHSAKQHGANQDKIKFMIDRLDDHIGDRPKGPPQSKPTPPASPSDMKSHLAGIQGKHGFKPAA